MEAILGRENMMAALRRVVANKGAPGADGMPVEELRLTSWRTGRASKRTCWRAGTGRRRCAGWRSQTRRRQASVGDSDGAGPADTAGDASGVDALFDPGFSGSSFGFRPGGAPTRRFWPRGRTWRRPPLVVDIDLEKFFDRVNHDVLMAAWRARSRQAGIAADPPLPASWIAVGRGGDGAPGGDAARRAALAALVEHPARRPRQGAGAARSRVLPLCRRLQHLCAVAACRRAADGWADPLPGRASAAGGQPRQERG